VTGCVINALRGPEQPPAKRYYAVSNSPLFVPLLRRRSIALMTHWTFQCLLYMDRSERLFKLGFEVLLTIAIAVPLQLALTPALAWISAVLIGHTLNFIFNGQFWVVLKHFGHVRHTASQFQRELHRLQDEIRGEPSIVYAAAYGSIARGELKETSDLDVRLVRAPGVGNGLRSCWFAARQRTRAFWTRFPLDVYVLDGYASLAKLAEKDSPVVLRDVYAERTAP
jgi:hypothetical protein